MLQEHLDNMLNVTSGCGVSPEGPSDSTVPTLCVPQEPEWDVSSAFFANAASHIKPKGSSRKSKENKENEARREVSERPPPR